MGQGFTALIVRFQSLGKRGRKKGQGKLPNYQIRQLQRIVCIPIQKLLVERLQLRTWLAGVTSLMRTMTGRDLQGLSARSSLFHECH
jgi:hypothetical protein